MKNKKIIGLLIFGILLMIIFIINKNFTNKIEKGTVEEALLCMDNYVNDIKHMPEYPSIIESFKKYLTENKVILNEFGTDSLTSQIDSAILFNKMMNFSCLFLIVQTRQFSRNDYSIKFDGTWENKSWKFARGLTLIYRRKKDSLNNCIPYKLDYLSREIRLEFIQDGFFKNKECEINWDYVEKWQ